MKRKMEDSTAAAQLSSKESKTSLVRSPSSSSSASSGSYEVAGEAYSVHVTNQKEDKVTAAWFAKLNASIGKVSEHFDSRIKAVVGLDCEWCPPWFRDNKPERVNTIQLYSPHADCLILSVGHWDKLPPLLLDMLADKSIAKVGVNISGDGARLARDFGCPVHGLLNLEKGRGPRMTMEKLCQIHCPKAFHINKDSVESKVRLGNWATWPLSDLQLKYASMDAVLSFAIFQYQQKGGDWSERCKLLLPKTSDVSLDSCLPCIEGEKRETELVSAPLIGGKNANFFLMHQNRSIIPPNMDKKEHPRGDKTALQGKVMVISGVLDSMSREQMSAYIVSHGGKTSKSITLKTTHLLNDHGAVGPSKLLKCQAQGVPVVSEDAVFEMVRTHSLGQSTAIDRQ